MRLITYERDDTTVAIGALENTQVIDFNRAHQLATGRENPSFTSMLALIEGGEQALDLAHSLFNSADDKAILNLTDVRLLAPIPLPPQIRDFTCFETHVRQAPVGMRSVLELYTDLDLSAVPKRVASKPNIAWQRQPVYYKCNRFAVSGPDDEIIWPAYSQLMDYELEIALVMGKQGKDISKAEAMDYVFGFTIFNDFSARDQQGIEMQGHLGPSKGKDFDKANAFGPVITTLDEIGDPHNLEMVARVNGEEWSRGNSRDMHWRFDDVISFVSQAETLFPGEILGSGTVGNGCGLELQKFLKDGDIVELEIEKIGVLRNRVRKI